jgi:hypothetical protein
VPTTNSTPKLTAPGPAIIDNNNNVTPPPCQARTRAQHRSSHVHPINSTITKASMPLIDPKSTASFPAHGYIAATQALIENYGVIHKANSPVIADSVNFIGAIINNITGNVLKYRYLIKSDSHHTIWQHSFVNELSCLFQGINDIKSTDTCFFIHKQQMPHHKQVTYGWICCNYCPPKDEPHRTQLTVGGDQITYNGSKSIAVATLITAKLLIDSTISSPKAKFYGMDLSNFYLMTPMQEYEYIWLWIELIPQKIIHQYNLRDLVNEEGWAYVKIQMGIYGLPQAGIIANNLLEQQLNAKGYYHCQHTPGLWRQVLRDISFCLVVDDFGIKSTSRDHILHLKTTLEGHYIITMDWDSSLFCGINIDWNNPAGTVNLNMPNYIPKALLKFQHSAPNLPQHQPYKHAPIQYSS